MYITKSSTGRIVLLVTCLLAAGQLITGCGGGSTDQPTPQPKPPPTPEEAALSLLDVARLLTETSYPLYLVGVTVNGDGRLLGCDAGQVSFLLNAAPAAVASPVPLGSHVVSATFANCRLHSNELLNGVSIVAYDWPDRYHTGSHTSTSDNLRVTYFGADYTHNGTRRLVSELEVNGATETVTERKLPGTNASVRNHLTGSVVTFVSGELTDGFTSDDDFQTWLSTSTAYEDFTYTLGSATVTLSGRVDSTYENDDVSARQGVVEVKVNGEVVARVDHGAPAETAVTVLGSVPSF